MLRDTVQVATQIRAPAANQRAAQQMGRAILGCFDANPTISSLLDITPITCLASSVAVGRLVEAVVHRALIRKRLRHPRFVLY
jgi:hypothetical protein